jgi:glycerophosphoryl diester phosphodiesterase
VNAYPDTARGNGIDVMNITTPPQKVKIIGHRGAFGYEPENTLKSINQAIQLGADMVEFDVYALPTGEIILMHDSSVDRTTNGKGPLRHLAFDVLRQLDAGKGERVPTLQEAVDLVDKRVPIIIEIKNTGSSAAVATVIEQYLAKGWSSEHFMVTSFNHHELRAFKTRMPQIEIVALIYSIPLDYAAFCEPLHARVVAPAIDMVTPEFVADAHKRGLLMYAWVWGPATDEEIKELFAMGVDGFYADYIDKARQMRNAAAAARNFLPSFLL